MIKVVHIMADGEVRGSIEGLTPPASCGCWDVLARFARKQMEQAAGRGEKDGLGKNGL